MTHKISVAIATYNGADFLEPQLDSILNQSRQPDEIVVCDDGSTDMTLGILRRYAETHPELFDIYQFEKNVGPALNFDRALERCSGDYIAICDQDDVWNEEKLAIQLERLRESESMVCYHDSAIHTANLQPDGSTLWDRQQVHPTEFNDVLDLLLRQIRSNFIQGASVMFDATLLPRIRPLPSVLPYDLWLTFIGQAVAPPAIIDRPLIKWRRHTKTDTGTPGTKPGTTHLYHQLRSAYEIVQRSSDERFQRSEHRAKRSREFARKFSTVDKSSFQVDPLPLGRAIYERVTFFENRSRVHDTDLSRRERFAAALENQIVRPRSVHRRKSRFIDDLCSLFGSRS